MYQEIIAKIENAQNIVLIAHKNPDADSMGSASAMYTFLMQLHKKATLYCVSENIATHLQFLPWFDKIRHNYPKNADLALSFDCGNKKRLGVEPSCSLINFDHHISNDMYGDLNCVNIEAESTSRVLFDFFESFYAQSDLKMNAKMATALYAGLIDDTQNFLQGCSAQTFNMARKLLEAKADKALCDRYLFQSESLAALRLKGLMFQNMELIFEARVAMHLVTREMIEASGAKVTDSEAALQESLFLPSVILSVLLWEYENGDVKGSFRSKSLEGMQAIDVNTLAATFGGGGHKKRSGFEIKNQNIQTVLQRVKEAIQKEFS